MRGVVEGAVVLHLLSYLRVLLEKQKSAKRVLCTLKSHRSNMGGEEGIEEERRQEKRRGRKRDSDEMR